MDWWNEMMTSDYVMFDDEWDKMCKINMIFEDGSQERSERVWKIFEMK